MKKKKKKKILTNNTTGSSSGGDGQIAATTGYQLRGNTVSNGRLLQMLLQNLRLPTGMEAQQFVQEHQREVAAAGVVGTVGIVAVYKLLFPWLFSQ